MIFNKNDDGTNSIGTNEISLIATWTTFHNYQHIEKALALAKRKVINIIGKDIYEVALNHYNSDDYLAIIPASILDKLVSYFQHVFVNFAYAKNMYKDSVQWDNAGINVQWSESHRPATQESLNKLSESFDRDGYEFLDLLIEFIKENEFTEFENSIENQKLKELFIESAEEFNYFFNINNSVSKYFSYADVMRRIQRTDISDAVGSILYANLLFYLQNKKMIDEITLTVISVDELLDTAVLDTIIFVQNENTFFIKKEEGWQRLIYDIRKLLELTKPAIVDLTIKSKFISDISNLKTKDSKQIEILRANINELERTSNTQISKIVAYVKEIENTEDENIAIDTVTEHLGYSATHNTFMI